MSENAPRDQNFVPTALFEISGSNREFMPGQIDQATGRILTTAAGGTGTVTSVSVVTANGFAGTVANATTTPAITISTTVTGILEGNGTAISAASTTGSGAVVLATSPTLVTPNIGVASGTSLTVTGALRSNTSLILEETGAGTDTITIQAPASIAASYTLTLPIDDGASGEVLTTNGSGVLSWASAPAAALVVGSTTITSGTDTRILYDNAGVLGEYTLTGTGTVVVMQTAPTFVTSITTPTVRATANDSGSIGVSGTAFSDLFLADGGVINWNAGNATITHSTGLLTINVPVTSSGLMTATGFEPTATTATGNRLYLPAANTLGLSINGTGEVQLTATAFSPVADGGNSLGTTALGWQNLFGNTGFVINIENGDWVATHTAGILTVGTGDLRVSTAGTNSASVVTVGGTQTLTNKTLTSPTITTATLSGAQQLAEGAGLRLDAVLSADGTYSGTTIAGTAGTTLAFGDLIYLAVADSRWELTDADSATTAGGVWTGMCVLAAASDGDPTIILLQGNIRADAAFPALTVGAPVYASPTPGDVQVAQPSGTDDVIHVVGFAITADSMYFNPSNDYITHT